MASDVIWGEIAMVASAEVCGRLPQLVSNRLDKEPNARTYLREFIVQNLRAAGLGARKFCEALWGEVFQDPSYIGMEANVRWGEFGTVSGVPQDDE